VGVDHRGARPVHLRARDGKAGAGFELRKG
jgi:hypothetical protein